MANREKCFSAAKVVYPNNKGLQTTYALGFDAGFDAAVVKLLKWAEKQKRTPVGPMSA